ncbi:pyridoxamine 5'-phosphate oxidase family protein [Runella slithyformis]|uniref:Pyridoxamine 5'-phosphate oxidase family protein n=1 Tax=Runella slithyformis (strain ATCC 29530 / DSM 19594 / LMG 11500 / NCIMB 11436 / LSU 4) TaxID=761193 RepID=A0A7U3ZGI8_RUNSL|nr:pyridoxamine 5'-phosphate oxidase family protein [Runella slithyformis]AEI46732.1 hypothetical protein Runsl_0280 [Runella slithyformis DSM 19594]
MQPTPRTIPSRLAKRAQYDDQTVYSILDEALFCTVSCVINGQPFSLPTAFVRYENVLYLHGSVGSHFIREIEKGIPVCITVMLTDALVVAKSAFHHSVNYRSVVLFSSAEKIESYEQKAEVLKWVTEKMVPNSWEYLRPMTESEVKKTTVLGFKIEEASAKIRTGMPIDDEEDTALPIWSGLIPLGSGRGTPIADDFSKNVPLPEHLRHLQ